MNKIKSLSFSRLIQRGQAWLSQGNRSFIFTFIYLLVGIALVYFNPRSLLAFLFFLSSALLIFYIKMGNRFKIGLAVLTLLVIIPILGVRNIFYLEVIFQISVFAALALGLNIVVGFAGLLDLGYVAFYAVGAYTWAFFGSQQFYLLHEIPGTAHPNIPFLLPADSFYLFVFIGVIIAGLTGILLGLPVLRLRGDYLAIVTLGFGEVIRVLANNLDKPLNLTNGPQGITPIQRPTLPPALLDGLRSVMNPIVGHNISEGDFYNLFFYLASLMVILVVIVVVRRLDDSKIGRAWTAIREDETAAIAMGIPLVRMKLAAFAAGASFAGAMGVLFAASRTFVSPESFSFMQSIGVLTMVILGGLGSSGAADVLVILEPVAPKRCGHPSDQLCLEEFIHPIRPGQIPTHGIRHHPDLDDDLPTGRPDTSRAPETRAQRRRRQWRGSVGASFAGSRWRPRD
jgi:branched-chain amino acid transport system permease protein